MKREIITPHWTNNARTVLGATFKYEDGTTASAVISASDNNPDYALILEKFSTDVLEENTKQNINKLQREQERLDVQEKANKEKQQQEALFAVKIKAFEIEAISKSSNREIKSKIRRAKTDVEVLAYAAALLVLEIEKTE